MLAVALASASASAFVAAGPASAKKALPHDRCYGVTLKEVNSLLSSKVKLIFDSQSDPLTCRVTPATSVADQTNGFVVQFSVSADPDGSEYNASKSSGGQTQPPVPISTVPKGWQGYYVVDPGFGDATTNAYGRRRTAVAKRPARTVAVDAFNLSSTSPTLTQAQLIALADGMLNHVAAKLKKNSYVSGT